MLEVINCHVCPINWLLHKEMQQFQLLPVSFWAHSCVHRLFFCFLQWIFFVVFLRSFTTSVLIDSSVGTLAYKWGITFVLTLAAFDTCIVNCYRNLVHPLGITLQLRRCKQKATWRGWNRDQGIHEWYLLMGLQNSSVCCAVVYWLTHCSGSSDTWDRLFFLMCYINISMESTDKWLVAELKEHWILFQFYKFYSNWNSLINLRGPGRDFGGVNPRRLPRPPLIAQVLCSTRHFPSFLSFSNTLDKVNFNSCRIWGNRKEQFRTALETDAAENKHLEDSKEMGNKKLRSLFSIPSCCFCDSLL